MNKKDLEKLTIKNAGHIETINDEMGDLRDTQTDIKENLAKVTTDVSWLKRFFWVVVTASIGSLIAGLVGIIIKLG